MNFGKGRFRGSAILIAFCLLAGLFQGCGLVFRGPAEISDEELRLFYGLGEIPENETWWERRERRIKEQELMLFSFPVALAWEQEISSGAACNGSPVFGARCVYVNGGDGTLIKLNEEDGTPVWQFQADAGAECSPVIESGGVLYFGTDSGLLFAIDPQRRMVIWKRQLDGAVILAPAVSGESLFAVFGDDRLISIDKSDGMPLWEEKIGSVVLTAPVVEDDTARIYLGCSDGEMRCLDGRTGSRVWGYLTDGPVRTRPLVHRRFLYFGSDDNHFYAVHRDRGRLAWKKITGGDVRTAPLAWKRTVVFGSYDGYIYAIDGADGRTKWRTRLTHRVELGPFSVDEILVAAALRSPELRAIDPETGRDVGSFKLDFLDAWFTTRPVLSPKRKLYVGTSRGMLMALIETPIEDFSRDEEERKRFEDIMTGENEQTTGGRTSPSGSRERGSASPPMR